MTKIVKGLKANLDKAETPNWDDWDDFRRHYSAFPI
jgi:hypothetical protein